MSAIYRAGSFEVVESDFDLGELLWTPAAAVTLEEVFAEARHPRGRTGEWIRGGLTLRHHGQIDAAKSAVLNAEIRAALAAHPNAKGNTAMVASEIAQPAGASGFGPPMRHEVATAHDESGKLVGLAAWEHRDDGVTKAWGLATIGHGKGAGRALVEMRAMHAAEHGHAVELGADPGSEGFHEHMGAKRVQGSTFRYSPETVALHAASARKAMKRKAPLVEAVHFDEKEHPRWPKGTPRGGQFIRVGQSFGMGGDQYEVAHVVKGKIYAHLKGGQVAKTVEVKASSEDGLTVVKNIKAPTPTAVKGGKGQDSTVTAVNPYVDHASHDPSIPIPAGSSVTPEQWLRFGKIDQEHYTELQERFGKWAPGAAQSLVDKSYAEFSEQIKKTSGEAGGAEAVSVVKTGYSNQYGGSSGFTLNLIGPLLSKLGLGHGNQLSEKAFESRERAMVLQGEHRAAVQWDLYNRTHSPDIFSVHKVRNPSAQDTSMWQKNYIDGPKRIFSGLSQSFWYRPKFFGDTGVSTPLAIRHILMSSYSAKAVPSGFAEGKPGEVSSELEISVPEQMILDARSTVFSYKNASSNGNKLSEGAMRWLTKETMHPVGGFIQDMLRDHFTKGTELPEIPADAHVEMDGAGKSWIDPEPEAWLGISKRAVAKSTGNNLNVGDHFLKDGKSYKVSGVSENGTATGTVLGGSTEAKVLGHEQVEHAQPIATAGLAAGDFVMGLQGARYVVVSDPSEPEYGLRYVELGDNGPTGQAYTLKAGGTRQFYKLDGHYTPTPVEVDGGPVFEPDGWTASAEDARFVSKLTAGEKFKVNNEFYEVVQQLPGTGNAQIRDLATGKLGKINTDYKTKTLVPKADYKPPAGTLLPGGEVVASYSPQKGDWVSLEGEKWEVSGFQKSTNQWRLKRSGQPGVKLLSADDEAFKSAHRPSDYVIGPKAKLRDIPVGEKFHMGAGSKQKPYVVVAHGGAGKPSKVRDISTGKEHDLSRNASYSKLVPVIDDQGQPATFVPPPPETPQPMPEPPSPPDPVEDDPGKPFDITDYEMSKKGKHLKGLKRGDIFALKYGQPFKIVGWKGQPNEKGQYPKVELEYLKGPVAGKTITIHSGKIVYPLTKIAAPETPVVSDFDPSKFDLGGSTPMKHMDTGAIVMTAAGGYFKVGEKKGNHVGVTSMTTGATGFLPAEEKAQKLIGKHEAPIAYEDFQQGDLVPLDKLKTGDQLSYPGDPNVYSLAVPPDDTWSAMLAVVNSDGSLGPPASTVLGSGDMVTFHKKADDVTTDWFKAEGTVTETDPASLPHPAAFQGYGSAYASGAKESGGFSGKHHKVSEMAPGTVFRDKGGGIWKVKAGGALPIITDGQKNFQVDGQLRGRVALYMLDLPQGDSSPPVGQPGLDAHVSSAESLLGPNVGNKELADLPVGTIWKMEHSGQIYAISDHAEGAVTAVNLKDGHSVSVLAHHIPASVAIPPESVQVKAPKAALGEDDDLAKAMHAAAAALSASQANEPEHGAPGGGPVLHGNPGGLLLAQMNPGDIVKVAPANGGGTWQIVSKNGADIQATKLAGSLGSDDIDAPGVGETWSLVAHWSPIAMSPGAGESKDDAAPDDDPLAAALSSALAAALKDVHGGDAPSASAPAASDAAVSAQTLHAGLESTLEQIKAQHGGLAGVPHNDQFQPFKSAWGSGGAYKHPPLTELGFGQKFTDKTGSVFRFVSLSGNNQAIIVSESDGQVTKVPAGLRVKTKGV